MREGGRTGGEKRSEVSSRQSGGTSTKEDKRDVDRTQKIKF